MKINTPKNPILVSALLGLMVAGMAQGAALRYQGSGDYTNVLALNGLGWYDPAVPGSPTNVPGKLDDIRFNYGGATVWLTTVVPDVARYRAGVDEAGFLVVSNGGKLKGVGTNPNSFGYNNGKLGGLTIYAGGELISSNSPLEIGRQGIGTVLIDGGTLTLNHHLWVGGNTGGDGTLIITNGGVVNFNGTNGNGMLGLGTGNAVDAATGAKGVIKVQQGGRLNLYNISSAANTPSIQGVSYLDISGSGVVTIPGDRASTMTNYVTAAKITAYGGTGTVVIDYNNTNPGFTTLTAIGGYTPPTDVTWDPAGNPSTTGRWSENANWATNRYKPVATTIVRFNTNGAIPCVLNDAGAASYIIMGQDGPGGTLTVTNGGTLGIGAGDETVIGYNSNAVMVVAPGGTVSFATNVYVGLNSGAEGQFIMNGGSASVMGTNYLGWAGGVGTMHINGGTLNLVYWDEFNAIQAGSKLDVSGNGIVVINGDQTASINYFVAQGLITANGGSGTVAVDYNRINLNQTTVYVAGLDLPPARVIWNPFLNTEDTLGLWNTYSNWNIGMIPGNVTEVLFNVADAIPCIVTNPAIAGFFSMGDSSGPGGTLVITNGGSLTTLLTHWSGVGYSSNATLIVENGSSLTLAQHLWVGFNSGAEGTVMVNGGTVNVLDMFGLGWNGGKGTVHVNNGLLNLANWDSNNSIKGASLLNLTGTGTALITGNRVSSISNLVAAANITANGGPNVAYGFDSIANKTIIQPAPARQAITAVGVSGGNTTLTFQTAAGHYYHVESSPTLPATTWTRVNSSAKATGTSATSSFPASGAQMFYRVVSP